MDRFHTESKATYNCSFESNGTACPFYCYRPEDLLAHEKRHQDPTFKTRKRPLNNSSFPSTSQAKIQQIEPEYTKNELVEALKQQLSAVPMESTTSSLNLGLDLSDTVQFLPPTSSEPTPLPDATVVVQHENQDTQPQYSNISSANTSPTADNLNNLPQMTLYHKGLCMCADKNGILNIRSENLIPGKKYVCNDNYELEDLKDDTEVATTQTDTQAPASFTVTFQQNPGKNLEDTCSIM